MTKILIGICSTREDKRFLESFRNFWNECNKKYVTYTIWQHDKFLPDAQNTIAEVFLAGDYDYLLFLDDDQWGHKVEMLDCLIEAKTNVATIKTYSRHYPYMCAAWDRVGHNAMLPIENGEGYRECDLTGFPMTLISRETFKLLEEPYFRPLEAEGRTWNSDVDFFDRLALKGVRPVACFQHCLNHDKITQENVFQYRADERLENNNIAWFHILKEQQLKQGV